MSGWVSPRMVAEAWCLLRGPRLLSQHGLRWCGLACPGLSPGVGLAGEALSVWVPVSTLVRARLLESPGDGRAGCHAGRDGLRSRSDPCRRGPASRLGWPVAALGLRSRWDPARERTATVGRPLGCRTGRASGGPGVAWSSRGGVAAGAQDREGLDPLRRQDRLGPGRRAMSLRSRTTGGVAGCVTRRRAVSCGARLAGLVHVVSAGRQRSVVAPSVVAVGLEETRRGRAQYRLSTGTGWLRWVGHMRRPVSSPWTYLACRGFGPVCQDGRVSG